MTRRHNHCLLTRVPQLSTRKSFTICSNATANQQTSICQYSGGVKSTRAGNSGTQQLRDLSLWIKEFRLLNDLAVRPDSAQDEDVAVRQNRCRMSGPGNLQRRLHLPLTAARITQQDGSSCVAGSILPSGQ